MNWKWALLGLGLGCFAVGMSLQLFSALQPKPDAQFSGALADALPTDLPGWSYEDLPLGETESLQERSEQILQANQYLHRRYERPGQSFSIFVAYWEPGTMPPRLVNQHTPDRCWVQQGWSCEERAWDVERSTASGKALQPAQWGIYTIHQFAVHTYFWHIVDGQARWYGGERLNTFTSPTVIWDDLRDYGFNIYREQFFVRITSQQSFERLWGEDAFQAVLTALAQLCLSDGAAPPGNQAYPASQATAPL